MNPLSFECHVTSSMPAHRAASEILREGNIRTVEKVLTQWRREAAASQQRGTGLHKPDIENIAEAGFDGVNFSGTSKRLVLAGAIMANEEKSHANPFHNLTHFREVYALSYMLGYDALKAGRIDEHKFGLLLTAVLIHDYKHDGGTNSSGGQFTQFRLEQLAIDGSKDLLKLASADKKDLQIIEALILATDCSVPPGVANAISPAASLKKYVRSGDIQDLHPRLHILAEDGLADMALMLHDADVGVSASISPAFNIAQGQALQQEWELDEFPDQKYFLDTLCQRQMFSQSGRKLLQPSMNGVLRHYGLTPPDA